MRKFSTMELGRFPSHISEAAARYASSAGIGAWFAGRVKRTETAKGQAMTRTSSGRSIASILCCAALTLLISACYATRVEAGPVVIYVSDFDLKPDVVVSESPFAELPLHRLR